MKITNRNFRISEATIKNYKFMCSELGLKMTRWGVWFIENELLFLAKQQSKKKVVANSQKAFGRLEEERKLECLVTFSIPLSDDLYGLLETSSSELNISKNALVEYSLDFACYRLIGFNERFLKMRKAEVKAIVFLSALGKFELKTTERLDFYNKQLNFAFARSKNSRWRPSSIISALV